MITVLVMIDTNNGSIEGSGGMGGNGGNDD